jgi:glutathione synthase
MRLGMVVNDLDLEEPDHDAPNLVRTAISRGHEAWLTNARSLTCRPNGRITARGRTAPATPATSGVEFLRELRSPERPWLSIELSGLDVVVFRADPSGTAAGTPWLGTANAAFGRLLAERRVIVLNDPAGSISASTKVYLQHLPAAARPQMLISSDADEIKAFAATHGGRAVIKPRFGSRGRNVFLLRSDDHENANQMIEVVAREGHVIVQEYVAAASAGDVRLLLLNGRPLTRDGRYAAVRRVAAPGEFRNNGHAGATRLPAVVDDTMVAAAELLAPRLIEDGLFLVGVDLAGDKVIEINVASPGGLGWATRFEGVDFYTPVIEAIEHKVCALLDFEGVYDNAYWATFDPEAPPGGSDSAASTTAARQDAQRR